MRSFSSSLSLLMVEGSILRVKKKIYIYNNNHSMHILYLHYSVVYYSLSTTVTQGVSIGMREDRGIGIGTGDGLRHQYVIKLHLFDSLRGMAESWPFF